MTWLDKNLQLAVGCIVLALVSVVVMRHDSVGHVDDKGPVEGFVKKVKDELIRVKEGRYMMGDYGVKYGEEGLPVDPDSNSKPVHEVKLSGFFISRFKITNYDYQFYLKYSGQDLMPKDDGRKFRLLRQHSMLPAHLDWFEANQYCEWLAEISGLPFSLPTEAQWEYSARSRGLFVQAATDNGRYNVSKEPYDEYGRGGPRGINISTPRDREAFAKKMGWDTGLSTSMPVDRFPPNPLGLYSMTDNGYEWVNDWYDPNYYTLSSPENPGGPAGPIFKDKTTDEKYAKVLRGADFASGYPWATTIRRSFSPPDATMLSPFSEKNIRVVTDLTARCVVNSSDL